MKLALLICDTPADHIKSEFGDYSKLFKDLLDHPQLEMTSFDVVASELPEINDFDAYLLTGSKFSANDNFEWIKRLISFLQDIRKSGKKAIGICFGHQLVARAFGGRVERNALGWEIGLQSFNLIGKGRDLFGRDFIKIQEMHQDHVTVCPDELEVVGGNSISPIQMMLSSQFYCLQGHPEYSSLFVGALIKMRLEKGIFTNHLVSRLSQDQVLGEQTTDLYRSSIWRFLGLTI